MYLYIQKTALHIAVQMQEVEIVKLLLLNQDIDVNSKRVSHLFINIISNFNIWIKLHNNHCFHTVPILYI